MTKRQHLTLDEVLDVLSDDEEEELDEPMMEGSDDEFSDLEMYDSDDDPDMTSDDPVVAPSSTWTQTSGPSSASAPDTHTTELQGY